jgi:O-antigen/teichoic acid export membrane protein
VAYYGAVFRLMDAARIVPAAALAVLLPSMFRGRDTALFRRVLLGLLVFGAAAALLLAVAAPTIVTLAFGAAYAPAAPLLRSLCMALPLLTLNYGLTTQLIGWNGQRAFAVINAAALITNIALNAWLIPRWGGTGAAWATTATEALITLSCLAALRQRRSTEE